MRQLIQGNRHLLLLGVVAPVHIVLQVAGKWLTVPCMQRVTISAWLITVNSRAGRTGDALCWARSRAAAANAREHQKVALLLSETPA